MQSFSLATRVFAPGIFFKCTHHMQSMQFHADSAFATSRLRKWRTPKNVQGKHNFPWGALNCGDGTARISIKQASRLSTLSPSLYIHTYIHKLMCVYIINYSVGVYMYTYIHIYVYIHLYHNVWQFWEDQENRLLVLAEVAASKAWPSTFCTQLPHHPEGASDISLKLSRLKASADTYQSISEAGDLSHRHPGIILA